MHTELAGTNFDALLIRTFCLTKFLHTMLLRDEGEGIRGLEWNYDRLVKMSLGELCFCC